MKKAVKFSGKLKIYTQLIKKAVKFSGKFMFMFMLGLFSGLLAEYIRKFPIHMVAYITLIYRVYYIQ